MFSNAFEKFGEDGNVRRRRYHGPKRREERPDKRGGDAMPRMRIYAEQ